MGDPFGGEEKNLTIHLTAERVSVPVKAPAPKPRNEAPSKRLTNNMGMKFVYIPPGNFMMGSPSNEPKRDKDEKQHRVTLTQGFYMQTTEVTQGQWQRVMGSNPSFFKNCGDDCPVEQVSWEDCRKFIRKLNRMEGMRKYRLPTEAEWEYAARAGTDTPFAFGDVWRRIRPIMMVIIPCRAVPKGEYRKRPVSVGRFSPMGGDFMICMVMYMSGAKTGTVIIHPVP